jgi:hypothetical protein
MADISAQIQALADAAQARRLSYQRSSSRTSPLRRKTPLSRPAPPAIIYGVRQATGTWITHQLPSLLGRLMKSFLVSSPQAIRKPVAR